MTRDEVLEALFRVFRDRGFEGATISEIAKACGLGKASLYHHFPDGKDAMLDALVRTVLARLDRDAFAPLQGHDAPKARIRAVIEGFGQYLEGGERNCLIGVLSLGTAHRSGSSSHRTRSYRRTRQRISATLDRWAHAVVRSGRPFPQARRKGSPRLDGAVARCSRRIAHARQRRHLRTNEQAADSRIRKDVKRMPISASLPLVDSKPVRI